MMFLRLKILALFLVLFPLSSWAFQLDWSGYYAGRAYYELYSKKSTVVFDHHLTMDSVARVSDGLSLNSRFILSSNDPSPVGIAREKGVLSSRSDIQAVHLLPAYFYGQYNAEFVQIEFGRLPFHFGLGLTYSRGDHFAEPSYDVRDGVSIKFEHNSFYVKPYGLVYFKEKFKDQIVGTGTDFNFALEAGYHSKDLEIAALYKSEIMNPSNDLSSFNNSPYRVDNTTNVFARYDYNESISVSGEWGSQGDWDRYAATLGVDWKTNFHSLVLNVVGGYATENYVTHTNWPPSFVLWDYFYIPSGKALEDHTLGLKNAVALYTSLAFDQWNHFNIKAIHVWMADRSNLNIKNNEFQLNLTYDFKRGFKWVNQVAYILMKNSEESHNRMAARSSAVIQF